jgi:hypothetical protein
MFTAERINLEGVLASLDTLLGLRWFLGRACGGFWGG